MLRRLEPEHQPTPARPGAPAGGVLAGCSVFVLGQSGAGELQALYSELTARRPWLADAGALIVWQVVAGPTGEEEASSQLGLSILEHGAQLAPGGRYFVPPHQRVWFEGTQVCLAPRAGGGPPPIDRLLLSLAETWGSNSAAFVALPNVDDAECGLRIIRAVGGLSSHRLAPPSTPAPSLARPLCAAPPAAVLASSRSTPGAARAVAPGLEVTRAFSLPQHLAAAARAACHAAIQSSLQRGRVRVWLPACRTGGLTYTVAMLLSEAARVAAPFKILVFGTDQDDEALSFARAGRYPARAAVGMDPELRGRYTFDEGETIRMAESLREVCVFSHHELARDLPMARMDLVVCHGIFEGVPPAERIRLLEALHYAVRGGGLLMPLDDIGEYPEDLFERVEAGYLRARSGLPRRHWARPPSTPASVASAAPLEAAAAKSPTPVPLAPGVAPFVRTIGLPLLLCDARLKVFFISEEARAAFKLLPSDGEPELSALSTKLPGGVELLQAARRVLAEHQPEQVVLRRAAHVYLARVALGNDAAEPCLSITFTDIEPLEAAKSQAIAQRHQHAALARLSELALTLAEPKHVYEEALALIFANISVCSAGVIVELSGRNRAFDVIAARGLGVDPLRTLRKSAGSGALLDAVVERGCIVSHSGELATWGDTESQPLGGGSPRPLPHRMVRASLGHGVACPISAEGAVLGVLALYGRRAGIEDAAHRDFLQAVANVLGVTIVRQRTRRRLSLELEVGRLLAGAAELDLLADGLQAAIGPVLSVEKVELWSARPSSPGGWVRIAPPVAGVSPTPPWPAELIGHSGTLFSAASGEHVELLVPIPRRDVPPSVLRLRGKGLHEPDTELSEGLQRIGRMLAEFLERLAILERSRKSEASYRQKSAELEALYSSLPVGITIHDQRGAIRHANRYLAQLQDPSGAPAAEPLKELYAREMPAWVARVLESGQPIHDVELFVTRGARTQYWLCNFAPILDGEGRVHGASAVVQDITALKRVESTLREADQQKDDFLAMLGHELRNPMAAIRNATELLGRIEEPTPQLRRLQSIFDRQTLQTTKLIDGLLDVARVARGKIELVIKPVQLLELVRQVVDDRRQQFRERTLDLRLPEGELWALADRVRLVQILDNLISNALRFTRPGGRIAIEVRRVDGRGVLSVEDDGLGIEPELLPQIFEPFRQGRSANAQSQGLGLGLALVKGLVELHGFRLMAHSEGVGLGAAFRIEFPVAQAPDSPAPESRMDLRGLELLLVEDNLDVAETLAELLVAAGHHVELAASAEAALERLRQGRPDVVLCDIGLPGMDGLALATRLRADPALQDLKLVAMTGFGDASTRSRIEKAGFDRHLIKPVQIDALRHCISRVAALPEARLDRC
jgi:signal transduction histidine kinase/ActR/RegA family two-component response regulator/SAM-dependent methyltransferase